MERATPTFKPLFFLLAIVFLISVALPFQAAADNCSKKCATEGCQAKCDMKSLKEEVSALQKKIEKMEKNDEWAQDDIDYLSKRVDKTEMHTATDKVSLNIEFRTKAESIHYNDMRSAPASMLGQFFLDVPKNLPAEFGGMPFPTTQQEFADFQQMLPHLTPEQGMAMMELMRTAGFNGANLAQAQGMMGLMPATAPEKYDADNNIIYTNKFRLNMKADLNPHVNFNGRLAAYKVFGDSTGVKFNQGSLGDVTFDGNTSSLPHGDIVHLERAFFAYKNDIGDDVHWHFSLGRRPSTDGPPLEYGNYDIVAGSPLGAIINWQFDGASLGFNFGDAIGIPGASFKLCYGVGFENDYGNSSTLGYNGSDLSDVHLFGVISDLFNNGDTRMMLNYAHAWDITDGFTGLTVMPFIVSKNPADGTYSFSQNTGGFITRMEPSTNIGAWDAATLLLSSNIDVDTDEKNEGIDWFINGSWSHTNPSQVSKNPFYEILGAGLLSSNGNLRDRDGYSVYAGTVLPMPFKGRLGLEYNWGSKYWFNFTGAEDSLIGSKLAVRGEVYEAYYIQPIYGHNFFAKIGSQYYDYEYTGSGNPLGAPVKIDEMSAMDALNPVADKVWNYYASVTFRY